MENLDSPREDELHQRNQKLITTFAKVYFGISGIAFLVALIVYLLRRQKRNMVNYNINRNRTELVYNGKFRVIKSQNGEVHSISIFDMSKESIKPFCDLEIINSQLFDLKNFGDFLDSVYYSREYLPVYKNKTYSYNAIIPYLRFFKMNKEVPFLHTFQELSDIYSLVDFGDKSLKDFIGTENALSIDNAADGNCLYYSVLFGLSNQLRDPSSSAYKKMFGLESKAKNGAVSSIYGFDEIRLASILALHNTKNFNRMSKHQLFSLVFYFKMLICTEIIDNLQNYRPFICNLSEYQLDDFLSNYYKMNREIEPMAISEMLNCELKIINVVSGKDKYVNPSIYFKTDEKKAYDDTIYLLYINNNHYRAIFRTKD